MIFWLYGRSGAGKTTLATKLESTLRAMGKQSFLLDGDELRAGICNDLGFGEDSRNENHRRAAEIAKLMAKRDIIVVVATMAPQRIQRDIIQSIIGNETQWIYIDAPIEVCAARDPKGLYAKADQGKVKQFREFPFELPSGEEFDLHLITTNSSIDSSFAQLLTFAEQQLT
ncbi:adenylyl-sulfate kinase [Verrucomicrobiales bacterium]|nr:adenylyl-sulfate kinase [Verrucomicrobiales bacterium]